MPRVVAAAWSLCFPWGFFLGGDDSLKADQAWHDHHIVVLMGLPGDAEHAAKFRTIRTSLIKVLAERGVRKENLLVFDPGSPSTAESTVPATRESITSNLKAFQSRLGKEDSVWIVFLGHADYDGEHARFHIPGPDLRATDYAALLKDLPCREQVIWLTMASSGWFLEPLSKAGRVVVTATLRDAEPNETEFPAAMVEALAEVDSASAQPERTTSVLGLFARIHDIVQTRYAADDRLVTEHALMDDNGDGRGSEWKAIATSFKRIDETADPLGKQVDGKLAAEWRIPPRTNPVGGTKLDPMEAEADPEP